MIKEAPGSSKDSEEGRDRQKGFPARGEGPPSYEPVSPVNNAWPLAHRERLAPMAPSGHHGPTWSRPGASPPGYSPRQVEPN